MLKLRSFGKQQSFEMAIHGIAFAGLATMVALVSLFLLLPKIAERTSCELEVAAEEELVGRALDIMEQKRISDAELAAANMEMESLLRRIPAIPNEAEFLATVCELAERTGLSIADYRPGTIETRDSHRELEVKMTTSGEYGSVCRFLSELHQLPRLSRLMQLDVQAGADGGPLTAEMTFRIFFSLPVETQTAQKG